MSVDLSDRSSRWLREIARERASEVRADLRDDRSVPEERREGVVGAVDDYVREDGYLRRLVNAHDVLLDVEEETRSGVSTPTPEVRALVEATVVDAQDRLEKAIEIRADNVAESTREDAIEIVTEGSA